VNTYPLGSLSMVTAMYSDVFILYFWWTSHRMNPQVAAVNLWGFCKKV
jgi:N6-adenosine-specific RNA methylase IME4